MPNKETLNNRREALRAMLNDRGIEVHAHADIDQWIQAELDKDAEDIDADFVDELVQLKMELEAGAAQGARASEKPVRRSTHRHPGMRRVSIALIALLVLSVAYMSIASAFNWADLARILKPLLQTIGIHMNVDEERGEDVYEKPEGEMAQDEDDGLWADTQSRCVEDSAEVPDTLDGYSTKPTWIPDGFRFNYGSVFEGPSEKNTTIAYTDGKRELFSQVIVYPQSNEAATNQVELHIEAERVTFESGIQVIEDHGTVTATLVDGAAYYMVWGKLPRQDIVSVMTSIGGEESN